MKPEKLKALRNKLGLSVVQSAEQVHVTGRSWSRYEDGTRPIPEGVIHLFCILNKLDYRKYLKE